MLDLLADFGLSDFYLELSTRDAEKEKFVGSEQEWADATEALHRAMVAEGLDYVLDEGGAAFYGPKVSVQGATPSAGPGSCPPSRSTSSCRSASSSSTRRPTAPGSGRS